MTTMLRAAAAAALTVALAFVLALVTDLPATSADARGNHWSTVVKLHRAKLQACKVPTTKHGPWKIRFRVDATHASTRVRGSGDVEKGMTVVEGPEKTHWIQPGSVSRTHTLRMPRSPAFTFQAGLETDTTGVASAGGLSAVSRC